MHLSCLKIAHNLAYFSFLFLMSCFGRRSMWPLQSPNKGEKSERLRGEEDEVRYIDFK